jgi:hypothetical protein
MLRSLALGSETSSVGPTHLVIDGLRDGSHTQVVEAENYLRSEPMTVRIDQTSLRRDVNVRGSHGLSRNLRVTTRNGIPVPGAM